jgi:predicted acyltransferase
MDTSIKMPEQSTPTTAETTREESPGQAVPGPARLQSLDVLRGITVAVMILVNTSGDGSHTFPILAHSRWNGCTVADVVFPCFLFMVGVSSVLSLSGRLGRGIPHSFLIRQALRRTAIIFCLGLLINSFPTFPLHTLRIFGVLQRIALCYLAATLLFLWGRTRTLAILFVSILLGYWILLRWVPVPGVGIPGSTIPFLDPHANLPAWLDRHLLPARHLYHQGFYDPEGLLSTIPSIASTLLGTLTGIWIRRKERTSTTALGILAASIVCLAVGLLWSHWFPLNKRLWTSSFVLWTGGISLVTLSLLIWLVDLRSKASRLFYPAIVFGTNALAAYVFSELLASLLGTLRLPGSTTSLQRWLYHPLAVAIPNLSVAALVYAILFVGVCFLPVLILSRKQIFLKV